MKLKSMFEREMINLSGFWCFADFRTPQSPGRTTLNRKGIYTRTREPKLAASVVKELFTNTPTYR